MNIPYDAFVLSALISSVIGFCANLYRLKTSKTERGVIIILLLIAISYILWNSYAFHCVRTDRIKAENSYARLVSGKVQKKWAKKYQVNSFSDPQMHSFFHDPEKYEYRPNVVSLLGNVMEELERVFPNMKNKIVIAQRGFNAIKKSKSIRPSFFQNDLVSGYIVNGGLLVDSGILYPPSFFLENDKSKFMMFALLNVTEKPCLEILKNDFKIKHDKRTADDEFADEFTDDFPSQNPKIFTNRVQKTIDLAKRTIALEDLDWIVQSNPDYVFQNLETRYKSSPTEISLKGLPKVSGRWISHPFHFEGKNSSQTKKYDEFPFLKSNVRTFDPSVAKKGDWIVVYGEKNYRLDTSFDDSREFAMLKKLLKTNGFTNVDANETNVLYEKQTLVDHLQTLFDADPKPIVLATSAYCPTLHKFLEKYVIYTV